MINFVNYDSTYCDLSWNWLNDEEIKKLTMTSNFTQESQRNWFNSLAKRDDYLIWGIECDSKPIGAIGLKNIDYNNHIAEYFGYIGEKAYWSKGIGKIMLDYISGQALEKRIDKIYLKVLKSNERAIKLYQKKGFIIYEISEENVIKMMREEK